MDGPVSVRRIYTDLVELGPSLFNVVRKGRNFLDERLGLMWNESITAIISMKGGTSAKTSPQLWRCNDLH